MDNSSQVAGLLEAEINRLQVSPLHLGESDGVKVIYSEDSLYGIELASEILGTTDLDPKTTLDRLRSLSELEGNPLDDFWKNVVDGNYTPAVSS